MIRAEWLAAFARLLDGCGYIYGAAGWVCNQTRINDQAKQYPAYEYLILTYGPKWIGKQCFDCAQLIKYVAGMFGIQLPSGATSQWKAGAWTIKGGITDIPDLPGVVIWREGNGVMQHVGMTIGGGLTIEAIGHRDGVVIRELSKGKWTHYALMQGLDYTKGGAGVMFGQVFGGTLMLREKAAASGKVLERIPNNGVVVILDTAAADGWYKVQYAGKEGYAMQKYIRLMEAGGSSGDTRPAVMIYCKDADQAQLLMELLAGATVVQG